MPRNHQNEMTKCRNENAVTLQQYANNKRIADQFNDVIVVAGCESIPANRLVLSCYSKFFESMFLSPMKERYQNEIEIQKFDGKAVRALIDFMYRGKIVINNENVVHLLAVADFLQMEDVKQFCFEFLEDNLSIDNCLEMVNLSKLYNCPTSLEKTYKLISKNLDLIVQTDTFKQQLGKSNLVSLISNLDSSVVKQSSVYNAILSWTHEDESRKIDFTELFRFVNLPSLSIKFLENVVSQEPLVKENNDCLNALTLGIFARLKSDRQKVYKILCVNGYRQYLVSEIYSSTGITSQLYPAVPNHPQNHCLLKLDNFVYCIGGWSTKGSKGTTNKVYRLNLSEPNLQWREVASMSVSRHYFGADVYNGCLVVNGNSHETKTTETYDPASNRWKNIAANTKQRGLHSLVATDGALFAIGGYDNGPVSSVERLDGLNARWKMVQSMNTPRYFFAAVACQGYIYAIGGYSAKLEKTVEKYHPGNNTWTYVSSMSVERSQHAACVLQGKVYVIGGCNAARKVEKTIECYDPDFDQWTVVGETKHECLGHAVVSLQESL